MATTNFQLSTNPLSKSHESWGDVSVIPWDSEIFGFCVAHFLPGASIPEREEQDIFHRLLQTWARENDVEMMSCALSFRNTRSIPMKKNWAAALQDCGWRFIELSTTVTLTDLSLYEENTVIKPLRLANGRDQEKIEQIAATAFRNGRYHADPLFPNSLANLRYRRWMKNAFDSFYSSSRTTKIYALGDNDLLGFMHIEFENGGADIRLNAIDKDVAPPGTGRMLYERALKTICDSGAKSVTAKIDAANMPVVNLYSSLGFRFSHPEWVLHWHAPNAPHLLREP